VVVDNVVALADLPPGPLPAAALARVDPARVPNNDLLALLAAQSRQASHEAARLLGVIAEINRATPTFDDVAVDRSTTRSRMPPTRSVPPRPGRDAPRTASATSPNTSSTTCPSCMRHSLPVGSTDPRCGCSPTTSLGSPKPRSPSSATFCSPVAGRLTPGQLVVRLRRLVAAIDPRQYERRYRKALRDRTVCAWLAEDGAAVLSARGLSPAQAQAAVERIDLLAHAARRTGHPSTLDHA
jgi:hypothetical protein